MRARSVEANLSALCDSVEMMRSALGSCAPVPVRAKLGRRDISGHCLLLEAMNIGFVGPNLNLAVGADPNDGGLDVVLVTETAQSA